MKSLELMYANFLIIYRFVLFLLLLIHSPGWNAQSIFIDENFSDWSNIELIIEEKGDNGILDIYNFQVSHDTERIYFKFELEKEINLQEDNRIQILIDFDNDPSTGSQVNNMGADLVYNFGERIGLINGNLSIYHNDIELISAPTVSSSMFEFSFSMKELNKHLVINDSISILLKDNLPGGDIIPDSKLQYDLKPANNVENIPCVTEKINPSDLRILSYNVQRDQIFDPAYRDAYSRILKFIDADIMCFQEIYDRGPDDLLSLLEDMEVVSNSDETWYAVKDGNDLITVSRYPITQHLEVNGNSVVEVSREHGSIIIANCHLPCCDNDAGREEEIDALLGFIAQSIKGENDIIIQDETAIFILGDMNFVGKADQANRLITGDIKDNNIYGPDIILDPADGMLEDARPYICNYPAVYTWLNNQSSFPPGRLDYLLFKDSVSKLENSYILRTDQLEMEMLELSGLRALDTQIASDHFPLIADFSFLEGTSNTSIELENESTIIYPNPSDGLVHIESRLDMKPYLLLDVSGQIIPLTGMIDRNKNILNLVTLPGSRYYLIMKGNKGIEVQTIILK